MKFITKIEKLFVFLAIKIVGKIKPKIATQIQYHFYKKWGMKFEGKPNYIASSVYFDGGNYSLIQLGGGITISERVSFLTHDWALNTVVRSMDSKVEGLIGRHLPIIIGKNVFIGWGVLILPGVEIGEGSIIGAGAIVRGKIPPFSLVMGNPSKIIGDTRDYIKKFI